MDFEMRGVTYYGYPQFQKPGHQLFLPVKIKFCRLLCNKTLSSFVKYGNQPAMNFTKHVRINLIGLFVVAALVFFTASAYTDKADTTPQANPEGCCLEDENKCGTGEMIWESLPRQFISSMSAMR